MLPLSSKLSDQQDNTASLLTTKISVFTEEITAESKTDHHEDFGEKFGAEQLQHAVEDVFPAVVQDVAVPVRQSKHGPRRQLGLGVVAEHDRNVFNRL